jgi:hypothetical protein
MARCYQLSTGFLASLGLALLVLGLVLTPSSALGDGPLTAACPCGGTTTGNCCCTNGCQNQVPPCPSGGCNKSGAGACGTLDCPPTSICPGPCSCVRAIGTNKCGCFSGFSQGTCR